MVGVSVGWINGAKYCLLLVWDHWDVKVSLFVYEPVYVKSVGNYKDSQIVKDVSCLQYIQ